jgi:transposase-like protein
VKAEEDMKCPHHQELLKLIAVSKKLSDEKESRSERFRCPVQGCGYTYTYTVTTEVGDKSW